MPGHEPLRCVAVRVLKDVEGEIDNIEFEAFLNGVAGRHQWISTTEWLFVDPPIEAEGHHTRPVVMLEGVAIQAILADLKSPAPRILFDHKVTRGERGKWMWIAAQMMPIPQSQGQFPWEREHA